MEAAPQPEQDNQPAEVPASTERHLQAVPDLPAEESASFDGSQLVEKKGRSQRSSSARC
jgi:hypothetical protein